MIFNRQNFFFQILQGSLQNFLPTAPATAPATPTETHPGTTPLYNIISFLQILAKYCSILQTIETIFAKHCNTLQAFFITVINEKHCKCLKNVKALKKVCKLFVGVVDCSQICIVKTN